MNTFITLAQLLSKSTSKTLRSTMFSKPTTLSIPRRLINGCTVNTPTQNKTFSTLKSTKPRDQNSIVNQIYHPQSKPLPTLDTTPIKCNQSYSDIHNQHEWDDALINESLNKHCLMAWYVNT